MSQSPYDRDLDRNAANFQPLTPLTFLERAAAVFPDRLAIAHGRLRRNYRDFHARSKKLASALAKRGFVRGDTVAVMLANTPAMLECHYGVPMCGAVLNTLNTRLDAAALAFMLDHGEAKALIVDREFSGVIAEALKLAKVRPLVVDYDDPEYDGPGERIGAIEYEALARRGRRDLSAHGARRRMGRHLAQLHLGDDGRSQGRRLSPSRREPARVGNVVTADMGRHPVYLWTLPMFHCNGWCFPWSISVKAGAHVCLRQVRAKALYDLIAEHKVTHLCGAPIVMSVLLNARPDEKRPLPHLVRFFTAAAPPPAAVLKAMGEAGFEVTHLYGLTETYGPAVVNDWKDEWNALDPETQAHLKARQGVRYHALEALDVLDPETMQPVAGRRKTMGEVMFRGNVVMKGYLKNKASTDKAFAGGWFHSGDLGVKHPDGYVQLRDRSKDIIISGGENISSIEVEDALFEHPGVQLAAVVARPDEKWGETPCAFVEMKPGHAATAEELIEWCRDAARALQVPAHDRVRRDPEDLDRQGAEIRAARAGETARPDRRLSAMRDDAWPRHCRAAAGRVGGGGRAAVPRAAASRRQSACTACARR